VAAAPAPASTAAERTAVAAGLRAGAGRTRPAPDDIDTVNLFAALPDVPPSLPGGRRRAGANRVRLAQALSSVARDAVALFTEVGFDDVEADGRPTRLSRCSAEDCGLVFYDSSRGGTRRWCSMHGVTTVRGRADGPYVRPPRAATTPRTPPPSGHQPSAGGVPADGS
jgi:predicted RNA-binding Zn ribbon-like protein